MNDIEMTKEDYEDQIKKEERYLARCKKELLDVKSRISSTEMAIKMWRNELAKLTRGKKKSPYENKMFQDLPCKIIPYKGRGYCSWEVEVNPGETETFAEMALFEALSLDGALDNHIDCSIAYYVELTDNVLETIEEFND
jgi:hypothetical protein